MFLNIIRVQAHFSVGLVLLKTVEMPLMWSMKLYAFFWVITHKKAYNIQNTAAAWN